MLMADLLQATLFRKHFLLGTGGAPGDWGAMLPFLTVLTLPEGNVKILKCSFGWLQEKICKSVKRGNSADLGQGAFDNIVCVRLR